MGRRGNHEGSIYQTKDGRWRAAVVLPDGRRKYVSGVTREAVARRLRQVQRLKDEGLPVSTDGRAPTVEAWLTHWLEHIAAAKVRPSTMEGYRSKVTSRIVPGLGRHRLDRLQPEHVEAWRDALLAEGLAPATVLQCQRVLSRALKVAMQRGKVARNVCALVDAASVQREEVRPLSASSARLRSATTARRAAARSLSSLATSRADLSALVERGLGGAGSQTPRGPLRSRATGRPMGPRVLCAAISPLRTLLPSVLTERS